MLTFYIMKSEPKQHAYISMDPTISGGSPVISGTRVRIIDIIIEYDRLGMTPDEIIDAHPQLSLGSACCPVLLLRKQRIS